MSWKKTDLLIFVSSLFLLSPPHGPLPCFLFLTLSHNTLIGLKKSLKVQ